MNIVGKLENIKRKIDGNNVDILGLCEIKWEEGEFTTGSCEMLYVGETRRNGEGIIVKKDLAKMAQK